VVWRNTYIVAVASHTCAVRFHGIMTSPLVLLSKGGESPNIMHDLCFGDKITYDAQSGLIIC
jgi:hypothetical protein